MSKVQPKSILKKTQPSQDLLPEETSSIIPTPQTDAEQRRLNIAIEHARLIQDQKDVILQNLNSIEELSDIPESSTPTKAETGRFLSLVLHFQPSDYDALIEERHVNSRCGYTLCSNPPRKADAKRPWLRPKGSENWCSNDCAKRALYVKAQLDESPAWERRGGSTHAIVLYDETRLASQAKLASEQDLARAKQRELALERGEGKVATFKIEGTTSTEILEKTPTGTAVPPTFQPAESEVHKLIEGYQTKGSRKNKGVRFDDDEDDDSD